MKLNPTLPQAIAKALASCTDASPIWEVVRHTSRNCSAHEANNFFTDIFKETTKGNFYGIHVHDSRTFESVIIVYFKNGNKLAHFKVKSLNEFVEKFTALFP